MARPKVPQRSTAEKVGQFIGGDLGGGMAGLGIKGTLKTMKQGFDEGAPARKAAMKGIDDAVGGMIKKTGLDKFGTESFATNTRKDREDAAKKRK